VTPAPSNYLHLANQTVFWDTTDSIDTYKNNLKDCKSSKLLHDLGYVDYEISYKFNSHGFRTPEFDQKIDMVCFGCSFTMGTGVRNEHTWPSRLADLTGSTVANLGHAGSSNDTAYRMARHYLHFLRPKYAIWLQTDMHRVEIIDESINTTLNILASDNQNMYANNLFVKTWMSSVINQQINLDKNTQAFRHLCFQSSIIPIIIPFRDVKKMDMARDLQHPGPLWHQYLAEKVCFLIASQHKE
jgi:hypothetical protein